jgi:S1-C subfamily serine protease
MRRYYQILGVSPDATPEEIKAAWLFSIKAFHPDKFSSSSAQHQRTADARTKAINEAYTVLSNPLTRSAYDREFRRQSADDVPPPRATAPPPPPPRPPPKPPPASAPEGTRPDSDTDFNTGRLIVVGVLLVAVTAAVILTNHAPKPRADLPGAPVTRPTPSEKPFDPDKYLEETKALEKSKKLELHQQPSGSSETSVAGTFDLPRVAREARKAVLLIVGFDAKGKVVQSGSGFFISSDGRIATNRHVVTNVVSATAKSENGAIYRIDGVLTASTSLDLAVLKADARQVSSLALEAPALPEVGSRIAVIGSPLALEGTLSEGIVGAVRVEDDGTWVQITAPLSPGSSGSPVLNGDGRVVGVATLNSSGRIQNLNFARSARDLATLVEKIPRGAKPGLLSNLFLQERSSLAAVSPSPTSSVTYRISGLPERSPFLNVREGPGANFRVVVVFPATGRGITLGPGRVTNGTTVWQEIFLGSYHGWVNAEYLAPETPDAGGGR